MPVLTMNTLGKWTRAVRQTRLVAANLILINAQGRYPDKDPTRMTEFERRYPPDP